MRKVIISLIVLLVASLASSGAPPDRLPSLVPPVEARGLMMVGGGVPVVASCSTTQQSNTTAASTLTFNNDTNYSYVAFSFTANASYSIYNVTTKLRRVGTGGDGNMHLYLCTTDGAAFPNERPTSTCTEADATVAVSSIATGGGEKSFAFAAGYAVTNATVYWAKIYADGANGDASNYTQHYYDATNGPFNYELKSSDNTPTWAVQDSDCTPYYTLSSCAP